MLVASVTSVITDRVTEILGNHGVYAVFLLMLVDAVFPAASELVMLYAGALAAGAFASGVVLFGNEIESGFWAWSTMVAGRHDRLHDRLDHRLGDRPLRRPAVPRAARSLVPPRRTTSSSAPSAGSTAGATGPC